MKTLLSIPLFLLCGCLWLTGCGQGSDKKTPAEQEAASEPGSNAPANMAEAMKQAEKAVQDLQGNNANITPVNFRKLKELLPENLLGMARTRHTGESAGAMGMKFSTAEAEYKDGEKRLRVKIVDAGGLGVATLGMAAWSTVEIDREDDQGYERTSTWNGLKALEKCRTARNDCSFNLFNPAGIIAEIECTNIPVSDLKKVAEQINLAGIPGMRE